MAEIKVAIVKDPGPGKTARVINPHIVVSPGDDITFLAKNTDAVLFFPEINLFGKDVVRLTGAKNKDTLKVSATAPPDKAHYYAIWVDKDNDFADVGSYPSIIVD